MRSITSLYTSSIANTLPKTINCLRSIIAGEVMQFTKNMIIA